MQYTGFSKESPCLETSLIQDLEDGQLDTPFTQASLVASGVLNNKKMFSYMEKIDLLISQINHETDIITMHDPITRAKIIFDWLQKNANDGVYNDCYDIRHTLSLKVGNCLSYTIRFTILCRHFDIDTKNIIVPGHIYNAVTSNGQTHYFEHTHSDGVVKNADMHHPQKRFMKDIELIAEIFLYKARNANNGMKYAESIKYCQYAMMCNPDDNRPVILLLDNYIVKKNYEVAFQYLNDFLSRHPDDKKSFHKTYIILERLCKKGG